MTQNLGSSKRGFTLPELLVSMTILLILMLLLTSILSQVQKTWNYSEGRISQFREARVAFDVITKNLKQASLNTYWDYDYNDNNQVSNYKRQSELHFVSQNDSPFTSSDGMVVGHSIFFQAPLGFSNKFRNLNNLYNGRGYYILFGSDENFKPSFIDRINDKYRYRLMEYFPPAEENQVFNDGDQERLAGKEPSYDEWWNYELEFHSHPLAENIIAIFVSPRDSLTDIGGSGDISEIAPDFGFDSSEVEEKYRHQVPPLVRFTLVAIDEESAIALEAQYGTSLPGLVDESDFRSAGSFTSDLEALKNDLNDKRVDFKIFSTMIAIRTSKWSSNERPGVN